MAAKKPSKHNDSYYARFAESDWQRVPGGARQYVNKKTGAVISRRAYDEHYGAVKSFGTNERKAKANRSEEQLLRPARGRKSARKLTGEERDRELSKRRKRADEKAINARVQKMRVKRARPPKKIRMSTFRKGTSSRRFAVNLDIDEINEIRINAANSGIIFAYYVGLSFISINGDYKSVSLFRQRYIKEKFTPEDMDRAINIIMEKSSYMHYVGAWMQLKLTEKAGKRNGAKYHY